MTKDERDFLINNTRNEIDKWKLIVNKSKRFTRLANRQLKLTKDKLYKLVENL